MFSWFKKKKPEKPETYGQELNATFTNDEGSWEESVHLLDVLGEVMAEKGYELTRTEESLIDLATQFTLTPEFLSLDMGEGALQTCTITTISHPDLIPEGLFEYQHSVGEDLADSIRRGFDMWEQVDYAVLKEAVPDKPESLTHMEMAFPAGGKRRILFGPVAHHVENRAAHEAGSKCSEDGEEHPFCPCCLFTSTFKAFRPQLESDGFFALRMYAARNERGGAEADCRINGHDHRPGMAELKKYVKTWPQAGFEFRKQYVVIRSVG